MRVLALEPFYSGSHKQFLDGWINHSKHEWTVLGLPGHKWKWRMRHAPVTFAKQVRQRYLAGERWDAIFCSDMLNLGEFLSLAPRGLREVPSTVYFHENQFTYPTRTLNERDFHFAFTNYVTALTADQVWFNSEFHRQEFLSAVTPFLKRMPDNHELETVDIIRAKSIVQHPGIEPSPIPHENETDTFNILWSSRWEFDKNPDDFFRALSHLRAKGCDFRIILLGESFSKVPKIFVQSRVVFLDKILQWGYASDRSDYYHFLAKSDVIVSTAIHEFFGLGIVEAMSAGVRPLLPRRLSYPELVQGVCRADEFLYDGGASEIAKRLHELASGPRESFQSEPFHKFHWSNRSTAMDAELEKAT